MTLSEGIVYYGANEPRGEFVLVIEGKSRSELKEEKQKSWDSISLEDHMKIYEEKGLDKKSAMKAVAKDRGISKREVYSQLLKPAHSQ